MEQFRVCVSHSFTVVGVHPPEPEPFTLAVNLRAGVAKHLLYFLANEKYSSAFVSLPDDLRSVLDQPTILLLPMAKFFLGSLALGDVRSDPPGRVYLSIRVEQRKFVRSEEHTSELQSRQYLVC